MINKKIEQNKAQYDLDRQTVKISALSSGNISIYEFLTSTYLLSEKDLFKKTRAMKRFEQSPLCSELEKQTDLIEKH